MERNISFKYQLVVCALCAIISCITGKIAAQTQSGFMQIQCQVTIDRNGELDYRAIQYAVFKSKKKADNAYGTLKVALTEEEQLGATGTEFDTACKKLGIEWKQSTANGMFRATVFEGQGVLLYDETGKVLKVFEIVSGKAQYNEVLKVEHMLKEVTSWGTRKSINPTIKNIPSIDTGFETNFNVNITLPKGYTKNSSRLIVQPMAVDCQTEDTIAYLPPIVFEGKGYHRLQTRRMAFDYEKNDSLSKGYTSAHVLYDQQPFVFDTTVVFRKPDKDKIYRGAYNCSLEDYHRVIWTKHGEGGSCLAFRPFKFLDFSVTAADLPLTEEFYVGAESNFREVPRDLKLKFEVGTDKLVSDSANYDVLDLLTKELRSYGENLMRVSIQGAASPEGRYEQNKKLADKRARVAMQMVRKSIPSDVNVTLQSSQVYTWNDVLAEVAKRGNDDITNMVSNVINNNKENEVFGILKGLPFFESDIEPILDRQRIMKCSYIYSQEHVMEADEALFQYKTFKHDYLTGKKKFSEGDYYNLFSILQDSTEQDTLTMMAYNYMVSQPAYANLKLSPYIANRMAMLNIRRGTPDTKVLSPFIDITVSKNDFRQQVGTLSSRVINRSEMLLNQAITYFQDQKPDTAMYFLDRLGTTTATQRLRMYINFSMNYVKYLTGNCSDKEIAEVLEAEKYVLNASEENKAIIFTELHSWQDRKREEIEPLVDKMDDNNPKKWYLKGILWSDEAGTEPVVGVVDDGFKELTDMEYWDLQQNNPEELNKYLARQDKHLAAISEARKDKTPYFLAYFQHCFDLEPKYKRMYYNEGNVSDETRKKFPYKKKDIPAYRNKFAMLKAQADLKASDNEGNTEAEAGSDKKEATNQ